jgi:hypothetical protein
VQAGSLHQADKLGSLSYKLTQSRKDAKKNSNIHINHQATKTPRILGISA